MLGDPGEGPVQGGLDEFRTMQICMLTTTHLPRDGRIFEKEAKPVILSNSLIVDPMRPASQAKSTHSVVYMAGNMQMFHGIKECIQAISEVAATFPDVSLTLVGNIRQDVGAIAARTEPRPEITMTG